MLNQVEEAAPVGRIDRNCPSILDNEREACSDEETDCLDEYLQLAYSCVNSAALLHTSILLRVQETEDLLAGGIRQPGCPGHAWALRTEMNMIKLNEPRQGVLQSLHDDKYSMKRPRSEGAGWSSGYGSYPRMQEFNARKRRRFKSPSPERGSSPSYSVSPQRGDSSRAV